MPTKIEKARLKAEELISKDNERIQLGETLKRIQDRTDPDGNITVTLDDKTVLKVQASAITTAFETQKTSKEAELDVLATQFDGK